MTRLVPVASVDDFPEGERRTVVIAGKEVSVVRHGGRFRALRNRCPHANGRLGDGVLREDAIVCPLHQWRFSLVDGRTRRSPHLRAELLGVRVEEGLVLVEVPVGWDDPGGP